MSEGYSTVLRWEGVAKADVKPRMRHNGREAEEEAGIVAVHGNELINAAMTARNESYIWPDGVREPLTGPNPIGQMYAVAEARWSQAQHARLNKKTGEYTPRGTPSNAAHVAEFVLQLDPKFTGPSWSQFEDTFEDGAVAYLKELERRRDHFAEALESARITGEDFYEAQLDAEGAQIELEEGREDVDRWRGTITERREATDTLLRAMIDKVHEWMDVDGTKASLVSDHIHHDETSPHAQIFAVPVGDERELPGGVTERKLSLKQLLVGHSPTRSEAQCNYSERHDEMRSHINDVARAHGIDYVATMERVDSQRSNLGKTQLRRHRAEQLRQRMHDMRVADNVVEAGDRLKDLASREAAVTAREEALSERETAVAGRENSLRTEMDKFNDHVSKKRTEWAAREESVATIEKRATETLAEAEAPEIRRLAKAAGTVEAQSDSDRIRSEADDYAAQTKDAADQVLQKAQADARRRREEADELVAEAERERQAVVADREAAAQQRARAATALVDAEEMLSSVKSIPDFNPAVLDGDTRDAMKQVDADFLDRLCEQSPKIAGMREREHGSLWVKNQAQRDLANRTVEENRLRARRLRERMDSPKMGREDRSWQERHRGPSGPQANF
ncbi:hypothetical protein CFAL_08000 [Corynebacterium falsenii DSM 44353]|uniref:hypothetical protein n=1 Tax=Corynebacterium falsenii TaxID=108486 RepID=UPI0003E92071|nr:hypothetical protein [Corynebacterium falsenii]AHI04329.1 hypothetical protein CFAL_08000 [Corynebacterium falsenii DSM 44353]UBI04266.1 hypothetical protein LA343_09865 [Corynebacterium falsenii]